MGTMGKRKRRRTRSDEPGGRQDVEDGPGFPVFRYGAFTPEGTWERLQAVHDSARRRRRTGRRPTRREQLGGRLYVALLLAIVAFFAISLVVSLVQLR